MKFNILKCVWTHCVLLDMKKRGFDNAVFPPLHCECDEMHLDVCTWRLLYHRVSPQCSEGCLTKNTLIFLACFVECTAHWNYQVLRFSTNRKKKIGPYEMGTQGASNGKKAHCCLVCYPYMYLQVFLWCLHQVITGLQVLHRIYITLGSNIQLPVLETECFFVFFLRADFEDSGFTFVHRCVSFF